MPRPSVRDVAERAGVSVGTVSHVLNHPERVAQPTRDRVHAAIDELGFVRSEAARRLRHGGSSLVGVLVHDISNPFFTEAARGIEDRLREDGRVPMLGSTDSDPERERELMTLLAGMDVHGVIVTPSASTLDNLAVLAGRGIRVVLMDHPPISAELSTVSGDDVAAPAPPSPI
ncbi:LacI family DNA-binding transcriptional regulator [Actinomyces ruminis]|uniref:LacI family DNA-binding transcriptional regulator n=1 Tax=Actinomyces ruminis TaxID=1937003 RepID=UPI00211DC432|nr:LacI family DNA-binding transcriptional regulator [Actinomyces ruminis]